MVLSPVSLLQGTIFYLKAYDGAKGWYEKKISFHELLRMDAG